MSLLYNIRNRHCDIVTIDVGHYRHDRHPVGQHMPQQWTPDTTQYNLLFTLTPSSGQVSQHNINIFTDNLCPAILCICICSIPTKCVAKLDQRRVRLFSFATARCWFSQQQSKTQEEEETVIIFFSMHNCIQYDLIKYNQIIMQ